MESHANNGPVTPAEMEYIRCRLAAGATQEMVAAETGRAQSTISKAAGKMALERVKEAAKNLDLDVEMMRSLGQLEWVIETAQRSHEASCRPRRTNRGRFGPADANGASMLLPDGEDDDDRSGDSRFLAVVLKAVDAKNRMLGLDPDRRRIRDKEQAGAAERAARAASPDPAVRLGLRPLSTASTNLAADGQRMGGPPPAGASAGMLEGPPEQPTGELIHVPDPADLDDGENLEDWLVTTLRDDGENLTPSVWEAALLRLGPECWERLLPKMPPVFQAKMKEAAVAELRRMVDAEIARRKAQNPPPDEPDSRRKPATRCATGAGR